MYYLTCCRQLFEQSLFDKMEFIDQIDKLTASPSWAKTNVNRCNSNLNILQEYLHFCQFFNSKFFERKCKILLHQAASEPQLASATADSKPPNN